MTEVRGAVKRVSEMVREMFPRMRTVPTPEERDLSIHLRANDRLYESLTGIIRSRIEGRDHLPVPTDPLVCKSLLERNAELRWLLGRLDFLRRFNPEQGADDGEQPAA